MKNKSLKSWVGGLVCGTAVFIAILCVMIATEAFRTDIVEISDSDSVETNRSVTTEESQIGNTAVTVSFLSLSCEKLSSAQGTKSIEMTSTLELRKDTNSNAELNCLKYILRKNGNVVKSGFADLSLYIDADTFARNSLIQTEHSLLLEEALLDETDGELTVTYELTWTENETPGSFLTTRTVVW